MNDEVYLTSEGEKALRAELKKLTTTERNKLAVRLRDAIQMGDLSENADYKKAKEDQGFLEGRIQEIEYKLRNAIIINEDDISMNVVGLGNKVTIQNENENPEEYLIVGASEADPRNGRISNDSPIGSALISHKVGEKIEVTTPGGKETYTILKIE
ncbi:MAG TPA: transcription elongation factor GreA [Anaerolineales bacterium]|nr:transcription elongation factor GreA [Anaerolineales bacterium]